MTAEVSKTKAPKIDRLDYILIEVGWKNGFKHTIPCRGFDVKGLSTFLDGLTMVEYHKPKVVTEKQYNKRLSW